MSFLCNSAFAHHPSLFSTAQPIRIKTIHLSHVFKSRAAATFFTTGGTCGLDSKCPAQTETQAKTSENAEADVSFLLS